MLPAKEDVLDAFDRGWAVRRETSISALTGTDIKTQTLDVLTVTPIAVNETLYEDLWDHHVAGDYYKKAGEGENMAAATGSKSKVKMPGESSQRPLLETTRYLTIVPPLA